MRFKQTGQTLYVWRHFFWQDSVLYVHYHCLSSPYLNSLQFSHDEPAADGLCSHVHTWQIPAASLSHLSFSDPKASLMNHTYIYYLLIFQLSLHIRHTPFYQRFRQIYLAALRAAQDLGVEIVPR